MFLGDDAQSFVKKVNRRFRLTVGQMSPIVVTGLKEHRTLTPPLLLLLLLLLNHRSEAGTSLFLVHILAIRPLKAVTL